MLWGELDVRRRSRSGPAELIEHDRRTVGRDPNVIDAVPGRLRNPPWLALRRSGLGGRASHLGGLALCGSVPRLPAK